MSVIATALKHLIAAGLSGDALVAAVAEIEASLANDVAEDTRSSAAKRQARYRERLVERNAEHNKASQSVTRDESVTPAPFPAPSPSFPPDPQTNPTPTHTPEPTPRARKGAGFCLPEHIPAEEWAEFVAMRQRIRKPLTDFAKNLAVKRLDKLAADGWPPGEVLNHCTLNSYQGIFPPKDRNDGKQPGIQGLQRPDPLRAALADAIAECEAEDRERAARGEADYPGSFASFPTH